MDNSTFSLKNKNVLVVGASSGIGRHAALLFKKQGANVSIAARRKDLLDSIASEIDGRSFYVDTTKPETIKEMLLKLEKIDVLLYTPGINIRKQTLEHTSQDWDQLMDVNLKGTWSLNTAVIKQMKDSGTQGRIINISSIYGHVTAENYTLYATSKAGVEHLTRSLALESAQYGIHVNAIAPGYIETDLNREFLKTGIERKIIERTPLHRLGKLEDLDGALLLLASDASSYITGTVINVDGGGACQQFL